MANARTSKASQEGTTTGGTRADLAASLTDESEPGENPDTVVVQWVGTVTDQSRIRTVSADDFKSVSVDHPTVTMDKADPMTKGQAVVSARAAEFLIEVQSGFRVVPTTELAFPFRA